MYNFFSFCLFEVYFGYTLPEDHDNLRCSWIKSKRELYRVVVHFYNYYIFIILFITDNLGNNSPDKFAPLSGL